MAAPTVAGAPTQTSNTLTTSLSGSGPSGVLSTDILLAHFTQRLAAASTPTLTQPAGWILLGRSDRTTTISSLWAKLAPSAGETGPYAFSSNTSANLNTLTIDRCTGADQTTQPDAATTIQANASGSPIPFPAGTSTATADALIMYLGLSGTADVAAPIDNITAWSGGVTEVWDVSYGTGAETQSSWLGTIAQASPGVPPSINATPAVAMSSAVMTVSIRPGGPVGDTTPPASPTGLTATVIT